MENKRAKKNLNKIYVIIFLVFITTVKLSGQVTIKNQAEFTYWKEYDRNIFEDWFDFSYQKNFLQLGLRYEINHPPDPFIFPKDTLLNEYELTYRYAEFFYKNLTANVGNFYSMFGRGLTLRTYEDRNLRVDNNIEGIKLNLSGSIYKIQGIAGKMRDKYNRREDIIYGIDGEIDITENLLLGESYLYQPEPEDNTSGFWSSRLTFTQDWGDFYGEIVKPDWADNFSYYLALNAAYSKFAATIEYKDYNQMSFKNSYGSEYNAAPSLTREHTFALLNRHPHALNQNDEKGYQVEITYFPSDEWEFLLNFSRTFNHGHKTIFEEYYGEIHHYFGEHIDCRFAGAWTFDFTTNTDNITPIVDLLYDFSPRDQLHFSYQHQHTINKSDKSEYDNELLLLEYSRAPLFSLALVGEYTNKNQVNNVTMDRKYWLYGNLTLNLWTNYQLSILYGSRQEGFICAGGICRYEPEFEGVEIKLINRF